MNADKIIRQLERQLFNYNLVALANIPELEQLLKECPDEGIASILKIYERMCNQAYEGRRAYVEAIAGGPIENLTWPLYNAIGSIYPYLDRERKDKALTEVLSIMDRRRYSEVNGLEGVGHTTGIREPLLLADICITRHLYWPGLQDELPAIKKSCPSFFEFQKDFMDERGVFNHKRIKSDFLVAYALLRSDFCGWGEDYARSANMSFLERTLRGIVALRFAKRGTVEGWYPTKEDVEKGEARLRELLPKSIHNRITPLRLEGGWVDWEKFQGATDLQYLKQYLNEERK